MCISENEDVVVQNDVTEEAKNDVFEDGANEVAEEENDGAQEARDNGGVVLRRTTRVRKTPEYLKDYVRGYAVSETKSYPPKCFKDIESRRDCQRWYEALKNEIETLETHGGMKVVDEP